MVYLFFIFFFYSFLWFFLFCFSFSLFSLGREREGRGREGCTDKTTKRHPLQTCSTVRFECPFILILLVKYRSKTIPYYSLDNFLVCHFHNRKFTIINDLLPLLSPLLFLPTLSSLLLFFVPYICGYLLAFSQVFPAF